MRIQVLDAEHKLLEEIFPRHVLEAMACSDLRRAGSAANGITTGQLSASNMLLANVPELEEDGDDAQVCMCLYGVCRCWHGCWRGMRV